MPPKGKAVAAGEPKNTPKNKDSKKRVEAGATDSFEQSEESKAAIEKHEPQKELGPGDTPPFKGSSNELIITSVPIGQNPRQYYLNNPETVGPPSIASSLFVPASLRDHLMRNKKDSALGVKFERRSWPPDQITNMEGAIHTYVTPIVLANMHGDYIFRPGSGHGMVKFDGVNGFQAARQVIISAAIQPDFENKLVMLAVCALGDDEVLGQPLPEDWQVLDVAAKQDNKLRNNYDADLRSLMIAFLLERTSRLPALDELEATDIISSTQAIKLLEDHIKSNSASFEPMYDIYARLPNKAVISIELLLNSAKHQLRNELWNLCSLAPQGFVYTSDPAVIFAQQIDATLLNRIQFAALKNLATTSRLENMKVFAFNDFADPNAVELLSYALAEKDHIQVVAKSALFKGPRNTYKALKGSEDALLVIHNNSDAFGQNIESEGAVGSLDGAIGNYSSAAASLLRHRSDLLDSTNRYL